MDKTAIRCRMRAHNRALAPQQRLALSEQLFRQIEQSEPFCRARCVALYCALDDEPATAEVLARWHAQGLRIVVPRVEGEVMQFYDWSPATQCRGAFGIEEPTAEATRCAPQEIDLMVVPGIAFTADGRRLGRGRGYYDRYLAQKALHAYTIGVCYPHQLLDTLPTEPHDQPLNEVVSACPQFE